MYRPWMNRRFGVELEMNDVNMERRPISGLSLVAAIRNALTDGGFSSTVRGPLGYVHTEGTGGWEVKTDGSCGYNGRTGWEIAQPYANTYLTADGENAELQAVCAGLATLSPRIDRSCGLHVNIDARDFDWKELRALIILWSRYEPFWFELCPKSRTNNGFCTPMRKSAWAGSDAGHWTRVDHALTSFTQERDFTTNMSGCTPRGALHLGHYWRSKRLEFRLGGGTISYEKIVRWVQLLLTVVQRAKNGIVPDDHPVRATWSPMPATDTQVAPMPLIVPGGWSNKGFSTTFVAKTLGLAPSASVPASQIPQASGRLLEWITARRALFAGSGLSDPIEVAMTRAEEGR